MMYRIHIAEAVAAEKTQKFLQLHNMSSYILNNGCKYENGKILEASEAAIETAEGYLGLMGAEYSHEC